MADGGPDWRGGDLDKGAPLRTYGLYPWYVAFILMLCNIMASVDRYVIAVVLEPIKHDLHLSDTQLGLLTGTSFALIFCVASIPLGRLVDIGNRRLILAAGIFAWSVAVLVSACVTSFPHMFAARVGVGLGEAALLPSAMSLIAAYFAKERITKGLAILSTGNTLGRATAFLAGGAIFGLLVTHGGLSLPVLGHFKPWQGVFVIAALVGIGVSILCLTIREPKREGGREKRVKLTASTAYFWGIRGTYMRVFCMHGLLVAAATALSTWTISLYVRNYGVSVSNASMILGATSLVAGPLANLFGGWLTDRLNAHHVRAAPLVVGAVMLALCPVAGLIFWLSHGLLIAIITYWVIYFAICAAGPAAMAGVHLVTPDDHRGLISSFYLITYSVIGIAIGPLLVGLFTDHLFHSEAAIGRSLALSLTVLSVIGLPLLLTGRSAFEEAMRAREAL